MLECCGLIFWSHPQIHISRELVSNGVRLANRWMFVIGMRSGRRVLRDPNLKAPADISAYRLNIPHQDSFGVRVSTRPFRATTDDGAMTTALHSSERRLHLDRLAGKDGVHGTRIMVTLS